MKKRITLGVVAFLLSTTMWAASPAQIYVHQSSGDVYAVPLQDVSSLTFAANNLVVHAASVKEIPLSALRKITFDKTTALENVQSGVACQAFVNDQRLTVKASQGIQALQIVNLAGQVVFAQQYAGDMQHVEIDLPAWAQGTYIVLTQTTGGSATAKIMLY